VTVFDYAEQPRTAPRALHRLLHSPAVPTTYTSRRPDLETIEEISAAAARQGYDAGFAEGLARATTEAAERREEMSQQVAASVAVLSHAVSAAQQAAAQVRAEVEAAAPKLAFALLEAMLGRETQLADAPGRDAITRVLALNEGAEPVLVRLHPVDMGALDGVDLGRDVRLVADPAIEPGGALAEIGSGILDGQLGAALDRVKKILFGSAGPGVDDDRAA
jgi:flagellar assembly protein FliH